MSTLSQDLTQEVQKLHSVSPAGPVTDAFKRLAAAAEEIGKTPRGPFRQAQLINFSLQLNDALGLLMEVEGFERAIGDPSYQALKVARDTFLAETPTLIHDARSAAARRGRLE